MKPSDSILRDLLPLVMLSPQEKEKSPWITNYFFLLKHTHLRSLNTNPSGGSVGVLASIQGQRESPPLSPTPSKADAVPSPSSHRGEIKRTEGLTAGPRLPTLPSCITPEGWGVLSATLQHTPGRLPQELPLFLNAEWWSRLPGSLRESVVGLA